MQINNNEVNIEELIGNVDFQANMQKSVNETLSLTDHQIEVLERFQINYHVGSLKEIVFLIDEVLDETDDEELELIASELAERDYYENTNK